jgi:hypothetical protein
MTPDEIKRLTQHEEIETFVIRFTVERLASSASVKSNDNAVVFTHDTGRRKHISGYDSNDVARATRQVILSALRKELEREPEPDARHVGTYANVTWDDRRSIAERARWAIWRLEHPDCYADSEYTAAKDRGLLCRLWARMLELEGQ